MTRHTLGNRGKDALISTMFQAGSHNNNNNIQVDLRKYLAMTSCLISAVIDLSLRSQPIKVLWSMCVLSVPLNVSLICLEIKYISSFGYCGIIL